MHLYLQTLLPPPFSPNHLAACHVVRKHWRMQIGDTAGQASRTINLSLWWWPSRHNTILRPAQPVILLQECEIASGEVDCDNRWDLEQVLCEETCASLGCGNLYATVIFSLELFLMLD